MMCDRTLKRWYNKINKRYFSNVLPCNVCVRYVNQDDDDDEERCEEKYKGWAEKALDARHCYQIVICPSDRVTIIAVLSHEMCHIATDLKDDHGPAFERQRQMLSDKGFFKKGAIYKGLTIF